jgi:hypothetical protein
LLFFPRESRPPAREPHQHKMLLRQAGGAAVRLAAARLPPLLLVPRRSTQARRGAFDADASRAVAVACRAAPSRGLAATSASAAAAAASVITTADRVAIIDLIHRFDDCLNRGRHEDVGAFFVSGGGGGDKKSSSSSNNNNGPPLPVVRVLQPGASSPVAHEGLPAIVAFFRACAPMARGNRHLILNSIVVEEQEKEKEKSERDGQGEGAAAAATARVRSARLLVSATNPPVLRASGVIEDIVVRVKEEGPSSLSAPEWRLLSRDLIMDPPAAAA